MKELGSSLLLPPNAQVRPSCFQLQPKQVTQYLDRAFHDSNNQALFPGAVIMQLQVQTDERQANSKLLP